jgi:hypothetical protein
MSEASVWILGLTFVFIIFPGLITAGWMLILLIPGIILDRTGLSERLRSVDVLQLGAMHFGLTIALVIALIYFFGWFLGLYNIFLTILAIFWSIRWTSRQRKHGRDNGAA